MAIVFGISSDYSFALANVLTGLRRYSPTLADDIIVYHDGLSAGEQARLNAILPCTFKCYEPPVELPEHRLTKLTFSRYEGFGLLCEYRHVLWLEVDLLICGDISGILEYGGTGIAACFEPGMLSSLFSMCLSDVNELSGCDFSRPYFNTGVLLLSGALEKPEQMMGWLYSLGSHHPEVHAKSADQGGINLMAQAFDVDVTLLPDAFNHMICNSWHPIYQPKKGVKVVHSITADKFWNYWYFRDWEAGYRRWLEAGGTPADAYRPVWCRPWLKHAARKLRYYKKQTSAWRHFNRRAVENTK